MSMGGAADLATGLASAWATVFLNATTHRYELVRGVRDEVNGLAYGRFEDRRNETGWSFLWLRTSSRFPDAQQMRAAGVLEGALTAPLLRSHYRNWYSRTFKDQLQPGDGAGGGLLLCPARRSQVCSRRKTD